MEIKINGENINFINSRLQLLEELNRVIDDRLNVIGMGSFHDDFVVKFTNSENDIGEF